MNKWLSESSSGCYSSCCYWAVHSVGYWKSQLCSWKVKIVYLCIPLSTEEGCQTLPCGIAGHLLNNSFIIKITTVWILTTMETPYLALGTVCHLWNLRRMVTKLQQCMKAVTCCTKLSTFRKVSLGIWRGEKEESELPLFYILSPSYIKCWVW